MAAEVGALPNGNYAPHAGYGGINQNEFAYTNNAAVSSQSSAPPASSTTPSNAQSSQQPAQPDISKDEVGWYFVEQYYTTLSRSPERLYLFYNKRSQFVSGVEADKVSVCVGQRSINDRIKDLDFQDCKVRVTNVDSQASDQNIVIQVIGEISNKSQPHKKFTQTFVLATQTNGYFVLNDIFRYLVEEEDETEQESAAAPGEEVQQLSGTESGDQEPAPTQVEPKRLATSGDAVEADAEQVDKELEEKAADRIASSEDASAVVKELVNGEGAEGAKKAVEEATAAPAPAEAEPEPEAPAPAPAAELERTATTEADVQPEKPKDPEPTPVASPPKQAAPQPAPAPKPAAPAVPMSWAARAAAASASRAPAATPAVPQQPAAKPTGPKPATPSSTQTTTPPASNVPSVPTAPAGQRQEQGSDAQDEWTAVGHNRQQSRQTNAPQQEQPQQNRGYIKNVHENVDAAELRKTLEQFGEISYFDIARQKNCAFVDFKTADAYSKAVESPFELAGEKLYVEERRIRPGSTPYVPRGQFQGGRGGRGGAGQGPPRGGFQGNRGGAGGAQRGRGSFAPGAQRGARGGSSA
ncbi:hypothetical protein DOTSEDRAFT_68422 [Dothistroma septosporum NZE10]|uniref:NTF2 domain-containing protein n=1 Tax=Dothistroma septosporum (strain NZE10 / CBS 128990) TaxID=675120 RepID=N1Q350_DOTSN|nr:hypothetical protein DOTSEDRAFT_68422 [Dothistroma septosporum NZE10]